MSLIHQILLSIPFEWAQYEFMHNALLAVLLITPLMAVLGCMVVNSHMAFFSDALGHAALTGIALGSLLGLVDPLCAMVAFSALFVIVMTVFRRYSAASMDTTLGLLSSFCVALGVVILSRGGGFAKYSRYLIGDILTISDGDILRLFLVVITTSVVLGLTYNRIFLVSLNRTLASSRGISAGLVEFIFAMTVALVVTVSLSWIGLLVINSLLVLPAAAGRNLARSSMGHVWLSTACGVTAGLVGLISSYYWGTASGATIVLVSMLFFVVSMAFRRG